MKHAHLAVTLVDGRYDGRTYCEAGKNHRFYNHYDFSTMCICLRV